MFDRSAVENDGNGLPRRFPVRLSEKKEGTTISRSDSSPLRLPLFRFESWPVAAECVPLEFPWVFEEAHGLTSRPAGVTGRPGFSSGAKTICDLGYSRITRSPARQTS